MFWHRTKRSGTRTECSCLPHTTFPTGGVVKYIKMSNDKMMKLCGGASSFKRLHSLTFQNRCSRFTAKNLNNFGLCYDFPQPVLIARKTYLLHAKNTLKEVVSTEYTELQPLLSGVHSVMRVKLVLAGEGGGCTPTPFHYYYPHQ